MRRIIIDNEIFIENCPNEVFRKLTEELVFPNPTYKENLRFGRSVRNIPEYIRQYRKEGNTLIIPRGKRARALSLLPDFPVVDNRANLPMEGHWEPKITLRPDQEPAVAALTKAEEGFIIAPAGSGKTVMGLELARRLQLKTLWIAHRADLIKQSRDYAIDFGLDEAATGLIRGSKNKIGSAITFAMAPTLVRRDLSSLSHQFGLVIIDEAHHVPCSVFMKIIRQLAPKRMFGLTATPYRSDDMEKAMWNSVGPVVYEIKHKQLFNDEKLIKPKVVVRKAEWSGPVNYAASYHELMEEISNNEARNQQIAGDIVEEYLSGDHCIIALVERTNHAQILASLIRDAGIDCEFLVGSLDKGKISVPMSERERIIRRFRDGEVKILIATYDLLSEGFDHKRLDRLFLAAPIKWHGTIIQSVGRIQRFHPDKRDAVVYDYVDRWCRMFVKQFEKRKTNAYERLGLEVHHDKNFFERKPSS